MSTSCLPTHPTNRHPLTGQPIRALAVRPKRWGKSPMPASWTAGYVWPVMGGAPDDPPSGGGGGNDAPPSGGGGNDAPPSGGGGGGNATDAQGRDLGYPAGTQVAEMNADQKAAYWQHQSQKHEGRYKALVGDRSFDDTRSALDEHAQLKRDQQTPAEQALQARYDQGRNDALIESNTRAATAILRANLLQQGFKDDNDEKSELSQTLAFIDVSKFVVDGDVDASLVAATAKRFYPSDMDPSRTRPRDFGGGPRGSSSTGASGAAGKAEADKRFGK